MKKNILNFFLMLLIFNLFSTNIISGSDFNTQKSTIIYSLNNFFKDYYNSLSKLQVNTLSSYFNNISNEEKDSYNLFYEALRLEINILNVEKDLSNISNYQCDYNYYNDFKSFETDGNFIIVSLNQEVKITNPNKTPQTNTTYEEYNFKLIKVNNSYKISTINSNSYYVTLLKSITPKGNSYKESADLYFNETKNLMEKSNLTDSKKTENNNPFSLKSILNYVSKMFSR